MTAPIPGWEATISHEPVYIPSADGEGISETLWIDVPAWRDPKTNTIFLDEDARSKLEGIKARYLGILRPQQLKELRETIGLTQQEMAELLQLGQKSWSRWETGRERPSRSMNVLLCALYDGRIDVNYLKSLSDPTLRSQFARWAPIVRYELFSYTGSEHCAEESYEYSSIAS